MQIRQISITVGCNESYSKDKLTITAEIEDGEEMESVAEELHARGSRFFEQPTRGEKRAEKLLRQAARLWETSNYHAQLLHESRDCAGPAELPRLAGLTADALNKVIDFETDAETVAARVLLKRPAPKRWTPPETVAAGGDAPLSRMDRDMHEQEDDEEPEDGITF